MKEMEDSLKASGEHCDCAVCRRDFEGLAADAEEMSFRLVRKEGEVDGLRAENARLRGIASSLRRRNSLDRRRSRRKWEKRSAYIERLHERIKELEGEKNDGST